MPLWSDDAVQRQLAREVGVQAFSTQSLIEALLDEGRIDSEIASQWHEQLLKRRIGDFSVEPELLIRLARADGWAPGPISQALARPAAWQDPSAAQRLFTEIFQSVAQTSPGHLPHWLRTAITGAGTRVPGASHLLAGTLLALAISMRRFDPSATESLLSAARAATGELGGADPLPSAVERILQTAGELLGSSQAATLTVRVFSLTSEEDRTTVSSIVFGRR
jgi:hypothetical protein